MHFTVTNAEVFKNELNKIVNEETGSVDYSIIGDANIDSWSDYQYSHSGTKGF